MFFHRIQENNGMMDVHEGGFIVRIKISMSTCRHTDLINMRISYCELIKKMLY
jgi:hypothetical protein